MSSDYGVGPRKRRKIGPPGSEPYVLRSLFEDVPLATDDSADVYITCVEYWDGNLYIGSSAAEILHFVCLPAASDDDSGEPTFILASRLPIPFQDEPSDSNPPGVRQIVILPSVNKACILCNGMVTFYMLPELSPAFGNTKVNHCRWIGGLDLNQDAASEEDPVIMIAVQNSIMLIRIGEGARRIKQIKFPGCLVAARRGTIACAADAHSYSLLEVEHQQKIPLFPISSSSEVFESGHVEDIPAAPQTPLKRSPSSSYPSSPPIDSHVHGRSSSLNTFVGMLQPQAQRGHSRSPSGTPDPFTSTGSIRRSSSEERDEGEEGSKKNISKSPEREAEAAESENVKPLPPLPAPKPSQKQLQPHVVSPTPSEFLLVTGTEEREPGVGMFVDMDGEVVRGTINFHRYPKSVVIDAGEDDQSLQPNDDSKEEYVLALIDVGEDGKQITRLEIQRWDDDPTEIERHKKWLDIPSSSDEVQSAQVGLKHTLSPSQLNQDQIEKLLQMVRLKTPLLSPHIVTVDPRTQESIEHQKTEEELFESQESTDPEGSKKENSRSADRDWESQRNAEEARFVRGLGKLQSSLVLWSGSQVWRLLKNPLVIQLDNTLQKSQQVDSKGYITLQRDAVMELMVSIQDIEPRTEAEFLGLGYVKQKASLLLYGDLLSMHADHRADPTIRNTERALLSGNLDPRLALLFIPLLRCEVLQGPQGIWIQSGLADTTAKYLKQVEQMSDAAEVHGSVLNMVKRFLLFWQQKRGYGSITDETYVLDSTDAALLHLVLEQDAQLSAQQRASSTRSELNKLVDNWKGNFERAVALLEQYKRLYVLSRLYQSQKMSRNVLKTWRRIIDGEYDAGGEVTGAGVEAQMRKYLVKIRDAQLVEEYGSWLAGRNPALGIQVFADHSSRVRLEPAYVMALLKERAPNAVQAYLEHLVFTKNYTQYADDLIAYYLDEVLSVLESSPAARESLAESYSTYRALRPPKPTYLNFITENTPAEPWWQSRLRLLQLLSGTSGTQFSTSALPSGITYSIPNVLARIEPYQDDLVSESIILDGLQGHHRAALRLLTHGLGDYDSAIRYCLFGGPRSATSSGGTQPELAGHDLQRTLFRHLLDEFLQIQDLTERIERTSDLLARFGAWFDVREVLELVPEDWSVDILGGFLVQVFRTLVSQSREARIERALSAGLNLRVGVQYMDSMEKAGPWVEDGEGLRRLRGSGKTEAGGPAGGDAITAGEDSDFGDVVGPTV
ncbi:Transforming growth factor-beta receptor-associated protein 1 [Penicillium rolfsii]|nr:Transforming growth factor-beta receptor-associated protein 1 [Penicillium rolfsii]